MPQKQQSNILIEFDLWNIDARNQRALQKPPPQLLQQAPSIKSVCEIAHKEILLINSTFQL